MSIIDTFFLKNATVTHRESASARSLVEQSETGCNSAMFRGLFLAAKHHFECIAPT